MSNQYLEQAKRFCKKVGAVYQSMEETVDKALGKLRESDFTTAWIILALIIVGFFLSLAWPTSAHAGGGGHRNGGGSSATALNATSFDVDNFAISSSGASATATTGSSANAAVTATGGAVNAPTMQSVNTKAYGAGSTGLTSTAPCLGSFGIFFNAVSGTIPQEGCIIRQYAEKMCQDDACRLKMACIDPDLPNSAKTVLGCKID